MAITDFFSDLYDSFTSSVMTEVHAEAPEEDDKEEGGDEKEEGGDDAKDKDDEGEGGGEEGGDEGGDDDEEEEEEEEDEPVDPKPKLEEDCARSAGCIGYKHHFEECVERVTAHQDDAEYKGPHENCVEEFFHLQHCATQCAAPKLFKQLK